MPSVLEDTTRELCKLSEDVHKFYFDIVFGTQRGYLAAASNMEVSMAVRQLIVSCKAGTSGK